MLQECEATPLWWGGDNKMQSDSSAEETEIHGESSCVGSSCESSKLYNPALQAAVQGCHGAMLELPGHQAMPLRRR